MARRGEIGSRQPESQNGRQAAGALVGGRQHGTKRDVLVKPVRIALHGLAFERVRRIEVRIRADARRAKKRQTGSVVATAASSRDHAAKCMPVRCQSGPRPPASRNAASTKSAVRKYWPLDVWWNSTTSTSGVPDVVTPLPAS